MSSETSARNAFTICEGDDKENLIYFKLQNEQKIELPGQSIQLD